jgi:hypothetical protein
MRDAFLKSYQEIGAHAEKMWASRILDDRVTRNRMFDLCTGLAIADMTEEQAREGFLRLTGLGAKAGAAGAADRRSPREAVQLMMQACSQAASQTMADLKGQFADIVLAFARRARVFDDPPPGLLPADAADATSPQEREDLIEEEILSSIVGGHMPLARMPVDLLEQVLFEVEKGGQIVNDANGTVIGLNAAQWVADELDFDDIFRSGESSYPSESVAKSLARTGDGVALADDFVDALGHMDLTLDGVPLTGAAEREKRFLDFFGDGQYERLAALLASRYMNPAMLQKWAARLEDAALGGRTGLLRHDPPRQAAFDIARDADDNVTLTATLVDPTSLARAPDSPGPQQPDGVILSQVVFRIPAESIHKGAPVVECKGARAIFAF